MWTDKYKPKAVEEFIGNQKLAKDFLASGLKKPTILYGAPGIGKSALAELAAKILCLEMVHITDENIANGKTIAESGSVFGNPKLIVIDNVDLLSDIKKVPDIIEAARNPILLITSDFDSKRLATVKKMCEKYQMKKPLPVSVLNHLDKICKAEGIDAEKPVLEKIVENAAGDIRAAVSDLEMLAYGRKKITLKDAEILEGRDRIGDIYKVLGTIFMKRNLQESVRSLYDLDEQPQNTLLWIDENVPCVYPGIEERAKAYSFLSRADVFFGRITSRQYWGFLRYFNVLMAGGVTVSRPEKINFARYQFPFYLIRMGQTKKERNLKKSIGLKMSPVLHCSSKIAANEYIPLYRNLIKEKKIASKDVSEKFRLEEEETDYLTS